MSWRGLWALTKQEQLRLRALLNAVVADGFGLDESDFRRILGDCDHPVERAMSNEFTRALAHKGFWRVDNEKHPELRQTVLSQVAFHDLKRMGLEAFLSQNDGEGWMLPETLRLAEYGLGHDDRAREPQPVASRLGPRFYEWQLEQSVEESWEECERHAELIAKIVPPPIETAKPDVRSDAPTDLFGNPLPPERRKR